MSVADRHRVLARFLTEADYEARLRATPDAVAEDEGVSPEYARRVARIEERRVRAFRSGRRRKAERRDEKA